MEAGRKYYLPFAKYLILVKYSRLLCILFSEWAQRVKPADGLIKKVN